MATRKKAAPAETPATTPAEPAGALRMIPLDRLMLSALNVRQTERDADVASLAEDIAARGLKQNLVVVPAHFTTGGGSADWKPGSAATDRFEVIAGGRRLQAMQLLVADGRLAADHAVPCMVEPRDAARETSLSENLHRVAMNPADEFEAFAAIVDQARTSEADPLAYCARRFGVTKRHVEGRLRLHALAPDVLEALRSGAIALDSAKAYAATTDHELQARVFAEQQKSNWKPHDPKAIRDALRGITLGQDDPRVDWLGGLDGYRAAGGRIEADLFMGEAGEERLIDVALLERLFAEAAELGLAEIVAEEGWQSAILSQRWNWSPKAPAGFERRYEYGEQLAELPAEERARSIAAVSIDPETGELGVFTRFRAVEAAEADDDGEATRSTWTPPTAEERAAEQRAERIALWKARLAVGSFTGTPLEGKACWPARDWGIHALGEEYPEGADLNDEDVAPDSYLVAILIRVPASDYAEQHAAAVARVDEIEAEEAAREEARRAAEAAAQEAAAAEGEPEEEHD